MRKIIACILSILLMTALAACDPIDYAGMVSGTWVCKVEESQEIFDSVLENIDLYEEEIALVKTKLYTAKTVTFNADKTYSYSEDAETLKVYLREFYTGMLADLYAGRDTLVEVYSSQGVDVSTLSEEEFYAFYAALYEEEDLDSLLDVFVENTYDFESIEAFETGTYTITAKKIMLDTEGTENDGTVEYTVEGDKLTLVYNDGTENYTRLVK